jgi:two-component system sensor histidine kinase YesM
MEPVKKRKISLKWSMIGMLVFCWLIPLVVIGIVLLIFMTNVISKQVEKDIQISTDKAAEICEMQLGEILNVSKMASYNTTVRDSYTTWQKEGGDMELYNSIHNFLEQNYKYDRNFLCTMIFFLEDPTRIYYTYNTYQDNNVGTTGYDRVVDFQENALNDVIAMSSDLDTGYALVLKGGHLYMVRNLVTHTFKPYALIVMELSPQWVFESLDSIWGAMSHEVYIDGEAVFGQEYAQDIDLNKVRKLAAGGSGYYQEDGSEYSYYGTTNEQQELLYITKLNPGLLLDDVVMLRYILLLVAVFLVPLIFLVFWFFHHKVGKPIQELVAASDEISSGNYGHTIAIDVSSTEFEFLYQAFNSMSEKLKLQFEKIYLEELALKDANIKALQSQINPHFLNNTMEIINWEARMGGNEKVCQMIQALATMLGATMNRKKRRYVPLSEEMEYVEAYLYIIQQRLGGRLQVEKQIDETLLKVEVPMLIVQPVVENAVEHGVKMSKTGQIKIQVYQDGETLFIKVTNSGALSDKDKSRIKYLLSGEQLDNEKGSLGIYNVNRRLKIIFGESSGLTIESTEDGNTCSTLRIALNHDDKIHQENTKYAKVDLLGNVTI